MDKTERGALPHGVVWRELTTHADYRGDLTELFRAEWHEWPAPVQWNFVRSDANVLRGVHAHPRHDDYLIVLHHRMVLGLKDLRRDSPTHDLEAMVELDGLTCSVDLRAGRKLLSVPLIGVLARLAYRIRDRASSR